MGFNDNNNVLEDKNFVVVNNAKHN